MVAGIICLAEVVLPGLAQLHDGGAAKGARAVRVLDIPYLTAPSIVNKRAGFY